MRFVDRLMLANQVAPRAVIRRRGRFLYRVTIEHGLMELSPSDYYIGRRWAQWGARRSLERYCKKLDYYLDQVVVVGEGRCAE